MRTKQKNRILENRIFTLSAFLLCLTGINTGCSESDKDEPPPQNVIISADKEIFKSDGNDLVTFSVTADGQDVSETAIVIYKGENNTTLSGNTFSTNIQGRYTFYASYKGVLSQELQLDAMSVILTLSVDKTSIQANGKDAVKFSAIADGQDVTDESEIYIKGTGSDIKLASRTFSTKDEGTYEFYAKYHEQSSDIVTLKALVSNLKITPDRTKVKAGESITFTALSDHEDEVSSFVTLHVKQEKESEKWTTVNGNVFTPAAFGKYTIYATYEGRESEVVEIEVSAAQITLSADKTTLKSTGKDIAEFSVYVDNTEVYDADIILKNATEEVAIEESRFSSNLQGVYTFYAKYGDIESEELKITVNKTPFFKQSCAMQVVATWCGYSPQMMNAFQQVYETYSGHIQIISLHRSTSKLGSTEVDSEDFLEHYNETGIPLGIMDFERRLSRSAPFIYETHNTLKRLYPATSGIAIQSRKTENHIHVSLSVKANETNEYNVYAFIVEDNIIKKQLIYLNNSMDNSVWDDEYLHNGVAVYTMPEAKPYTGSSLGVIKEGQEAIKNFSVLLKTVTDHRTIDYSNCRVVAYVLKKHEGKWIINNAATCSIEGSVDYKYDE